MIKFLRQTVKIPRFGEMAVDMVYDAAHNIVGRSIGKLELSLFILQQLRVAAKLQIADAHSDEETLFKIFCRAFFTKSFSLGPIVFAETLVFLF